MKRVGIITILKVNNYGAELQAYATQKAFQLLGYDAEIIDYLFYKNPDHKSERCSQPFYSYPLKNKLKEWALMMKDMFFSKFSAKRRNNFESFHREHTKFSQYQYCKMSDLYKNVPDYDVYCVGSDQVWNPRCYTNLSPYFLTFAPMDRIRFSYASSFGVSDIPSDAKKEYAKCLEGLDFISCREQAGVDLVKKLTGRSAQLVCDPTLLLTRDEWCTIAKPVGPIPKKYLLIYELHTIPYLKIVSEKIAKDNNLNIVRICKDATQMDKDPDVVNLTDVGPSEFVYLFANAEFIVTNSFHGTAFSINFEKDFYTVATKKKNNNSRQIGLLATCGLMDRLLFEDESYKSEELHIDYSQPSMKLDELRNASKEFIKRAIDGTN